MPGDTFVETWFKRIDAAKKLVEDWEKENRVRDCLDYYRGKQLVDEFDEFNNRRVQINKIHPEVRNNIPSLYYYRPFARLAPAPEQIDDPGTEIEQDVQLLQDTANHLIRDPETMFRESTFVALKEAHWAFGLVEVGYSPEFVDAPNAPKPPLKEKEDTKIGGPEEAAKEDKLPLQLGNEETDSPNGPTSGTIVPETGTEPETELASVEAEVDTLQSQLKSERFFVRHIPYHQVLISISDKPLLNNNDFVGYWEDMPLEDVKRSTAYQNTTDLKACTDEKDTTRADEWAKSVGAPEMIRLYKLWDLRTKERYVFAAGHKKELLRKPYNRCPLKFLRFDIDPYHFLPRPLILSKLGPQDEYNRSREWLSKVRDGIVPRYTYDEDALDAKQLRKLESGTIGSYIPRKGGTADPITPINQPSYSENALQTLTLSDKEFSDVGGVGSDPKIAQSKTATQAKIAETKSQVQDSFDRLLVAEWLSDIIKELISLATENMSINRWIAINVVPQSQFSMQIAQEVQARYARINADLLSDASQGINWEVQIDLESLSPVSEEEKFQKLMQGLTLFANPALGRLFSVSPELLQFTLSCMGIKSARTQQLILGAVQQVVMMEQQLAMAGQNASQGVPSQPGATAPAGPKAGGPQPGPPKPSGPTGPGAAAPKPPAGPKPM
jgi:hypothetical protein